MKLTSQIWSLTAGIHPSTYRRWRHDDSAFRDAVQSVEDQVTDHSVAEPHRRALARSDSLLIFLLKSRRPEVYGNRARRIKAADQILAPIRAEVLNRLSPNNLEQARKFVAKLRAGPTKQD